MIHRLPGSCKEWDVNQTRLEAGTCEFGLGMAARCEAWSNAACFSQRVQNRIYDAVQQTDSKYIKFKES